MRPWIAVVAAVTSLAAFVPLVQHRANAIEAQNRVPPAASAAVPKGAAPAKPPGPPLRSPTVWFM